MVYGQEVTAPIESGSLNDLARATKDLHATVDQFDGRISGILSVPQPRANAPIPSANPRTALAERIADVEAVNNRLRELLDRVVL